MVCCAFKLDPSASVREFFSSDAALISLNQALLLPLLPSHHQNYSPCPNLSQSQPIGQHVQNIKRKHTTLMSQQSYIAMSQPAKQHSQHHTNQKNYTNVPTRMSRRSHVSKQPDRYTIQQLALTKISKMSQWCQASGRMFSINEPYKNFFSNVPAVPSPKPTVRYSFRKTKTMSQMSRPSRLSNQSTRYRSPKRKNFIHVPNVPAVPTRQALIRRMKAKNT